MAVLKNQVLVGSIGPVTTYQRKGKTVLRKKKNEKSKKEPSPAQLRSRRNFKVAQEWVRPITDFVKVGFRNVPEYENTFNAAKGFIQKNALQEEGEEAWVDPVLAKVSLGSLGLAEDFQISLDAQNNLMFTWNTALEGKMSQRDRIMMLAYRPETKFVFFNTHGPFRMDGSAKLKVPIGNTGAFHIYAAFLSENGKTQSDSLYLGEVTL